MTRLSTPAHRFKRSSQRRFLSPTLADIAATTALVVLLVPFAMLRSLDGDEGVYAYAASQVSNGLQLPYRDFFWEQMPLVPMVYGGWFSLTGESWYSARLLSALMAIGIGALLYVHCRRRFGQPFALVSTVLYLVAVGGVTWFVTIKTYSLSTVLLLGSFVMGDRVNRSRPITLAASGLCAGMAVNTRLTFLLPALVIAWSLWRSGWWWIGFVGAGLSGVLIAALAPASFWFGVVGFHGLKTTYGFFGDLGAKLRVLEDLMDPGAGTQFVLLSIVASIAAIVYWRRGLGVPLSLRIVVALMVASLTPNPAFSQYYCVVIPFLIFVVIEFAYFVRTTLVTSRSGSEVVLLLRSSTIVVSLLYVLAAPINYKDVISEFNSTLTIRNANEVTAAIESQTAPGDFVLSSWPGYIFNSSTRAIPGTANPFGTVAAARLSAGDARRYGLVTGATIETLVQERRVGVVVFGSDRLWLFPGSSGVPEWEAAVRAGGYRRILDGDMADVFSLSETG